jgi:hypothetical protein
MAPEIVDKQRLSSGGPPPRPDRRRDRIAGRPLLAERCTTLADGAGGRTTLLVDG